MPDATVASDDNVDHLYSDTKGSLNWLLYSFDEDMVGRVKSGETETDTL